MTEKTRRSGRGWWTIGQLDNWTIGHGGEEEGRGHGGDGVGLERGII